MWILIERLVELFKGAWELGVYSIAEHFVLEGISRFQLSSSCSSTFVSTHRELHRTIVVYLSIQSCSYALLRQ